MAVCSLSGQAQKWLIEAMKTVSVSAIDPPPPRGGKTISDLKGMPRYH